MPESLAQTPTVPLPPAHADEARLRGGWLIAARGAFIAISALALGLFVVAIPLAYQQIITPHTGPQCADSRFSPTQFAYMHAAGVSPASLAAWILAVQWFSLLVFVGVGTLLFWRRSDRRMALLAATTLVLLGATSGDAHWLGAACALRPTWPVAGLLFDLLGVAGSAMVGVLFYTFPSGRWVPRSGGWVLLCWLIVALPPTLLPAPVTAFLRGHSWVGDTIGGVLCATFLLAQIYRYRRVSTPAERLQTKWVVLGSGIGLGGIALLVAWGALGGHNPTAPWWPLFLRFGGAGIQFCLTLIPISIGIALLRSRLFDVDTVINRVLVYGSLTGVLGLLYLAGVVALQGWVRALTGQTQPLIIVATTLAIAALVQPLRRALQREIDRRFYRRKYDAARTLADFGATLRNEVDLERLHTDLLAVVQETMQPVHASLWLRSPSPGSPSTPARPLEPAAAWTNRQARADSAELP